MVCTKCKLKGQDILYMAINQQSFKDKEKEWYNKSLISDVDSKEKLDEIEMFNGLRMKIFLQMTKLESGNVTLKHSRWLWEAGMDGKN